MFEHILFGTILASDWFDFHLQLSGISNLNRRKRVTLSIQKVDPQNRRQVKEFVYYPFKLYKDCPEWVPPLVSDSFAALNPNHYAYQDADIDYFLAVDQPGNGKPSSRKSRTVGRIAVSEPKRHNQYLGKKNASFLFFDCIDDLVVSQALFDQASSWARQRGLTEINGPGGLTSFDGSGVLVKGFEHRAALTMPYNYPYYDRLLLAAGFEKVSDSLSGYLSGSHELPPKIEQIAEKVKTRRGLRIKTFTTKQEMRQWIPQVSEALMSAFSSQPDYVPPSEADIKAQGEVLIQLADPALIKLVMSGERVVGFVFAYHDLTRALQKSKGRLFPLGWLYILLEKRRNDWVNINGIGLVPEHQRVGGDALLFTELAKSLKSYGFKHADIVAVNEVNSASRNDMEALGVDWYKAHRSYQKRLIEN